ncbi:DUF554 domain-containing protein [Ornithinimicrobium sp. INDO-MA30-4]|uniref:DUF554 domain-containing protein n=1 Tax=Ornithinimicrobium sp. INDO-MA30-4 TaxID=2908651 RepID=UPI0037C5D2FE
MNIITIVIGSLVGMALGHRLPEGVKSVVTDALGLVTLLVAGLSAVEVTNPALVAAVGEGVPMLVVLGSLLIGGIIGSLLGIERRLAALAGVIQGWTSRHASASTEVSRTADVTDEHAPLGEPTARERFIEGWLTTSLLFCIGPLTILGSLSDGLGLGIDQLVLKSSLDLFAAMAFAASFGVGVLFSAVSVGVVQGSLTLIGVALGSIVPDAHIAALTAVGGLLLVGIGLRLLRIKDVPVGDMLPAIW